MKRTEFVEKRVVHWKCEIDCLVPNRNEILAQRAEWDALAAEAAGIAWEPEAPALPERLYLRQDRLAVLATAPGVEYIVALVHAGNGFVPSVGVIRVRIIAEAVRRYNAWSAIRTWATPLRGAGVGVGRLLDILDNVAQTVSPAE